MAKKTIRAKPKTKPRKPRNYDATDITRIQLHRINDELWALKVRMTEMEAKMTGGPFADLPSSAGAGTRRHAAPG